MRRLIGDVLSGDQQLQDEEINWTLTRYSTVYGAAAECCRDLASQYARLVDLVVGELKTNYSARSKRYQEMAVDFESRSVSGTIAVYAGGISNADKLSQVQNPDRPAPAFVRNQFDDLLPEAPVGQPNNTDSGPLNSGS